MDKTLKQFERLTEIVKTLLAPQGCPWDRKQTPDTVKMYLLEETHEVMEAIENNDPPGLKEELGDLLFHILFLARLAEERDWFTLEDVIRAIAEKMTHRHPHIFGDMKVDSAEQVIDLWQEIKKTEKGEDKNLLDGIPATLPALERALHLTRRAAKVGFDWPDADSVVTKLNEEATELAAARAKGDPESVEHEVGDLLFTIVNLSRFLQVNPESALRRANARFQKRFAYIEDQIKRSGKSLKDVSLAEMDRLWEEAKKIG